jgi:hypothetical protein
MQLSPLDPQEMQQNPQQYTITGLFTIAQEVFRALKKMGWELAIERRPNAASYTRQETPHGGQSRISRQQQLYLLISFDLILTIISSSKPDSKLFLPPRCRILLSDRRSPSPARPSPQH